MQLSTITQFDDISQLSEDDVILVSHKSADNQYVSNKAKVSSLPFVQEDQYASTRQAGIVKVGNGLSIDNSHMLNADYSNLPAATSSQLGGIKVGANLQIAADGTLSAGNSYELPIATSSQLGGIKVGNGLSINDGKVSVNATTVTGDSTTTVASQKLATDISSAVQPKIDEALTKYTAYELDGKTIQLKNMKLVKYQAIYEDKTAEPFDFYVLKPIA